jgi:hypothetical protein
MASTRPAQEAEKDFRKADAEKWLVYELEKYERLFRDDTAMKERMISEYGDKVGRLQKKWGSTLGKRILKFLQGEKETRTEKDVIRCDILKSYLVWPDKVQMPEKYSDTDKLVIFMAQCRYLEFKFAHRDVIRGREDEVDALCREVQHAMADDMASGHEGGSVNIFKRILSDWLPWYLKLLLSPCRIQSTDVRQLVNYLDRRKAALEAALQDLNRLTMFVLTIVAAGAFALMIWQALYSDTFNGPDFAPTRATTRFVHDYRTVRNLTSCTWNTSSAFETTIDVYYPTVPNTDCFRDRFLNSIVDAVSAFSPDVESDMMPLYSERAEYIHRLRECIVDMRDYGGKMAYFDDDAEIRAYAEMCKDGGGDDYLSIISISPNTSWPSVAGRRCTELKLDWLRIHREFNKGTERLRDLKASIQHFIIMLTGLLWTGLGILVNWCLNPRENRVLRGVMGLKSSAYLRQEFMDG